MECRLGTEYDDAGIRQLLQQIPIEGIMRIRYQREPSYLQSVELQGQSQQSVVGFINNKLVGVGSRNLQKLYINGEIKTVGYISNLRFHPDARNGFRLIKGIRFLENHPDSENIDFHYATFISTNKLALKLFTSNRVRMPVAIDMGGVTTFSIPLKKHQSNTSQNSQFEFTWGDENLMPHILSFLQKEGRKKDFFPVLEGDAYAKELLDPSSFFTIFARGELVGVISVPALHQYRQYIMEGYSSFFSLLRVPLNLSFALRGLQTIPRKGEEIKLTFAGFPVVKDDDPLIFKALMKHVYLALAGSGQHYLSIALHEQNPLIYSLNHYPHVRYKSRLFVIKLEKDKFTAFKNKELTNSHETNCNGVSVDRKHLTFIDLLRL